MAIGVTPIHTMHHRLALGVGFDAEGNFPVAVHIHLLGKEGLNLEDLIFHPLNHLSAIRAVVGQEVDHPQRARFTDVPNSPQGFGHSDGWGIGPNTVCPTDHQ